jgi:hypothetical protein
MNLFELIGLMAVIFSGHILGEAVVRHYSISGKMSALCIEVAISVIIMVSLLETAHRFHRGYTPKTRKTKS